GYNANVGGVAGDNDGTITNWYNTGSISGSGSNARVGGVAGVNDGTITNCYNTGSISGEEYECVGGVAGNNWGDITNCYNTGSISGSGYNANVGGVTGYNSNGTITNCYNTGLISGSGYNANVGGMAGYNSNGTITNGYNTGSVSGEDNVYVGGVTGYNSNGTITNCYNIGSISDSGDRTRVGGVAGYNTGSENINNCYFNKDILGDIKGINGADTGIVKGLTTAEMTGMSYDGKMKFNYDDSSKNPWIIKDDEETDNGFNWYYPHLIGFEFDNEGNVITEAEKITNWPAYAKGTVMYTEPESNVYNGSALYPELIVKIGDDTYPENAIATYFKQDAEGKWKELETSDKPTTPGVYRISIKINESDEDVTYKYFSFLDTANTYLKKAEDGSWGELSGYSECIDAGMYRIKSEFSNDGHSPIIKDFFILPKELIVAADSGLSKIYGSTDPTLTYTASGFVTGESEDLISGALSRAEGENVGTYAITLGTLSAGTNYKINFTSADFAINKAEVTVKADDITITYGDAIPDLTATVTGIVAADENKQNLFTYTVSRDEGTDVGTYTITPSGEQVQGNYNVKYETGTLTIIKQIAGITKNPDAVKGLEYDGNNQELVTSGTPEDGITIYYALGDDNITAPAPDDDNTWSNAIPSAKDAGTYYVWFKAVADDNHSTDDEAACLPVTISTTNLTVTADDKTKGYGTADAKLTATVSGLKGTDTADMITYTISRAEGENAGTYAITPAGEAEQGNYTVTYVPGTYTITTSTESVYDITLSQDTYTYDGTEKVPTVTVGTGTTTIPATEYEVTITNNINAGTATATVTDVAGGNYNVSGTAIFSIEKANPAYTVPTGLTALTGKTLVDVTLPKGWTWKDKSASVGAAGANKFKAVYTPEDTVNYNTVEDIDVVVTVSEPAPDPTPAIIPDPALVVKPQPSTEPEVKEPELPYTTNESVTNKDGSITKIETTYNKDGSKTEKSVREYINGNKTTKLTLINDKGVNLIKASEAIKTNKKGTKTVSTNIQAVNGYNYQSEVKTTKSGKEVSEVKITNADKSSSYEKTVTYPDGNITKNSVKTKADGTADITFGKYASGTSVAGGKNDTSSSNSGSASGSGKSGSEKSASEVFASGILAGMQPASDVTGSAVFGTFGSKVDDTTISDMVAKVSVSITAPDTSLPADAETVEELRYTTTSNKKAKLVKCITASEKVTIPSKISINGTSYTVTTIGKNAFKKASSVKCVVLGKTITKFGKKAFNGISIDAVFVMKVKSDTRKKIAKLIKKSGYKNTIQVLYSVNK
ncbi:MAG: hypothetical protein IKN95_01635, partial [Lachnospiraceae bacterium]|nr:hypothetical protein [Lachnospiraceae bacterium]